MASRTSPLPPKTLDRGSSITLEVPGKFGRLSVAPAQAPQGCLAQAGAFRYSLCQACKPADQAGEAGRYHSVYRLVIGQVEREGFEPSSLGWSGERYSARSFRFRPGGYQS